MDLSNFKFFQKHQPELSELGQWAEKYAYSDPQSAVIKLRCFGEIYVGYIYKEYSLPSSGAKTFFEKLDNVVFKDSVEDCVVKKLHAIRMKGNNAAHPTGVSIDEALWLVKEAYFLSAWLYVACHGGNIDDLPDYSKPEPITPEEKLLREDKVNLEQTLCLQTEDLEDAIEELAAAEAKIQLIQDEVDTLNKGLNVAELSLLEENSTQMIARFDLETEETSRRISIQDTFSEYQLTNGQSELVDQIDEFLENPNDKVFLLKGYAGTGKTFITKGITEYFRSIGRNYILAAPTGKASKVISNKTNSPAYTIHKTIYSFKDIGDYRDGDVEGTQTYKFYSKLAVNEHSVDTVYIIDEASMVSDVYNEAEFFRFGSGFLLRDLLEFINLDHNDHRKKLIFIGDDAQLPPIGMDTSPALDIAYLEKNFKLTPSTHELTEVVRQKADSGVMHNALKMRESLEKNIFNQLDIEINHSDIEHVEYVDLFNKYLESCNHKINAESIIIALSNADVADYNKRIREHFFPGIEEITPGDKVMAVSNSDAYGFFISNGDFGQVREVYTKSELRDVPLKKRSPESGEVEIFKIPLRFRDVMLGFRDFDGTPKFFRAKIIENLLFSKEPSLSSDENKALYVDFCIRNPRLKPKTKEFKDTLRADPYFNALRLKFGYAITCHKAQGSEWNHVFVKCRTHQKQLSPDYFRWLYTAITRTSKRLYLMDEPHLQLGGGIDWKEDESRPWEIANSVDENSNVASESVNDTNEHSSQTREHVDVTDGNYFGIPESAGILLAILGSVKKLIVSSEFEIVEIQHNQYQEAYTFKVNEEFIRINFSYSLKKKKITSVIVLQTTEHSMRLNSLLEPLQNGKLSLISDSTEQVNFEFEEDFLNDFHQRILLIIREHNILIVDVEEGQYYQRYSFKNGSEVGVLDIYYNGAKQFKSCNPQKNLSTSSGFLSHLISVLETGLK